ncbi:MULTISPECIES: TIGR01459 family HAD-type hydrolase [unclassified Rhizobium]|uniref:TIGR01459 family HAD-type hydrolase n=1 Tax=unclassified Rhizobium TaxID=2613769 RepID=UPI001048A39E|nr:MULTISPECIES: TIGR01459 family HAD-type hydrolase [unclassified Rhizobium]MBB3397850.1 HAD superfamily hydrolase (TIGR01459 family) [Rhizobium sp. BK060]MBB4170852.1 HAD superfamily hydrolase (TIGR01459 family) [Rhizobium sp. BK538]TCM67889.1 HAD superfamily hydrolase (TIGR01459 family) [Rhizobium sp. BK068]
MQTGRLPHEQTIKAIAQSFRGVVLDIFGVIHDGATLYEPVHEALTRMRAAGMRICLLSNSPRRAAAVASRLLNMGLGPDLYQGLITSGEMARAALGGSGRTSRAPGGRRYWHAGPPDLADLLDGLALERVAEIKEADFILATGNMEESDSLLQQARQQGLPMVCANPDLEVMLAEQRIRCAGSLAARYEAIGGRVIRFGKPEPFAYESALRVLDLPATAVIAIGDSLATDISGANRAGIRSALVMTGVHHVEACPNGYPDHGLLAALYEQHGALPNFLLHRLSWN